MKQNKPDAYSIFIESLSDKDLIAGGSSQVVSYIEKATNGTQTTVKGIVLKYKVIPDDLFQCLKD